MHSFQQTPSSDAPSPQLCFRESLGNLLQVIEKAFEEIRPLRLTILPLLELSIDIGMVRNIWVTTEWHFELGLTLYHLYY